MGGGLREQGEEGSPFCIAGIRTRGLGEVLQRGCVRCDCDTDEASGFLETRRQASSLAGHPHDEEHGKNKAHTQKNSR